MGIGQAAILAGVCDSRSLLHSSVASPLALRYTSTFSTTLQDTDGQVVQPAIAVHAHRVQENEAVRSPGEAAARRGSRGSSRGSHVFRLEESYESPRDRYARHCAIRLPPKDDTSGVVQDGGLGGR